MSGCDWVWYHVNCLGHDTSVRQYYKSEHWAPCRNQTPSWYDWKIVESDVKPKQTTTMVDQYAHTINRYCSTAVLSCWGVGRGAYAVMTLSIGTDRQAHKAHLDQSSPIRVHTVCHSVCILLTYYSIVKSYEPPPDKTNKMTCGPSKTQISLGIRPVWSESSLYTQWIAKDHAFLMRTVKTLIRLGGCKQCGHGGCPGWSESSLDARDFVMHRLILFKFYMNYRTYFKCPRLFCSIVKIPRIWKPNKLL